MTWSIVAILLFSVIALWVNLRAQQERVMNRIRERPSLTHEEFASQFFPPEKTAIASKAREILGKYVETDISKLHPDDTFVDLETAELDSMATVGFLSHIEREFGIHFSSRDTERLKTFKQVVDHIARHAPTQSNCRM